MSGEHIKLLSFPENHSYSLNISQTNLLPIVYSPKLGVIYYSADSEPGSSGGVVLDNNLDAIALHFGAVTFPLLRMFWIWKNNKNEYEYFWDLFEITYNGGSTFSSIMKNVVENKGYCWRHLLNNCHCYDIIAKNIKEPDIKSNCSPIKFKLRDSQCIFTGLFHIFLIGFIISSIKTGLNIAKNLWFLLYPRN